jgi:hypothetical protein
MLNSTYQSGKLTGKVLVQWKKVIANNTTLGLFDDEQLKKINEIMTALPKEQDITMTNQSQPTTETAPYNGYVVVPTIADPATGEIKIYTPIHYALKKAAKAKYGSFPMKRNSGALAFSRDVTRVRRLVNMTFPEVNLTKWGTGARYYGEARLALVKAVEVAKEAGIHITLCGEPAERIVAQIPMLPANKTEIAKLFPYPSRKSVAEYCQQRWGDDVFSSTIDREFASAKAYQDQMVDERIDVILETRKMHLPELNRIANMVFDSLMATAQSMAQAEELIAVEKQAEAEATAALAQSVKPTKNSTRKASAKKTPAKARKEVALA